MSDAQNPGAKTGPITPWSCAKSHIPGRQHTWPSSLCGSHGSISAAGKPKVLTGRFSLFRTFIILQLSMSGVSTKTDDLQSSEPGQQKGLHLTRLTLRSERGLSLTWAAGTGMPEVYGFTHPWGPPCLHTGSKGQTQDRRTRVHSLHIK